MKCPFKLPLKADSVPKLIFEADAAGAIIVAGDAKKAYAILAINSHDRLVEALQNLVAATSEGAPGHVSNADGRCPQCRAFSEAHALLAELEQPNV